MSAVGVSGACRIVTSAVRRMRLPVLGMSPRRCVPAVWSWGQLAARSRLRSRRTVQMCSYFSWASIAWASAFQSM